MRILRDDTIALVIDIQEKLFPLIDGHAELEKCSNKLISGLKLLNIPIIVTEQYPLGIGYTIESVRIALGDDYKPIEKLSFSCCGSEEFLDLLKRSGRRNIIIIGIESHVCVQQTVIDLQAAAYQSIVIEDCISSRSAANKRIAIERMRSEGAIITSYESILFELLVDSGTKEFRGISKIVK
jgi:nicotinamidase-related amidase